jgi:hypothetical protein
MVSASIADPNDAPPDPATKSLAESVIVFVRLAVPAI